MKRIKSNGSVPEVILPDNTLIAPISEEESKPKEITPPDLTEEQLKVIAGLVDIEFTEDEKQVLSSIMAEAQQSINEHQQLQELVQQKRDTMLGLTKAADKVYRTVMILKKVNPDAYQFSWNPQTNEIALKKK